MTYFNDRFAKGIILSTGDATRVRRVNWIMAYNSSPGSFNRFSILVIMVSKILKYHLIIEI
jgi:hypothetical protein